MSLLVSAACQQAVNTELIVEVATVVVLVVFVDVAVVVVAVVVACANARNGTRAEPIIVERIIFFIILIKNAFMFFDWLI